MDATSRYVSSVTSIGVGSTGSPESSPLPLSTLYVVNGHNDDQHEPLQTSHGKLNSVVGDEQAVTQGAISRLWRQLDNASRTSTLRVVNGRGHDEHILQHGTPASRASVSSFGGNTDEYGNTCFVVNCVACLRTELDVIAAADNDDKGDGDEHKHTDNGGPTPALHAFSPGPIEATGTENIMDPLQVTTEASSPTVTSSPEHLDGKNTPISAPAFQVRVPGDVPCLPRRRPLADYELEDHQHRVRG